MRAVVQRVQWARVEIEGEIKGEIDEGLLILLGVAQGDDEERAEKLAKKLAGLRIFEDDTGKMNHSLLDVDGKALVVSQFTLFADMRKGKRPFFGGAEAPERATSLCDYFCHCLRDHGVSTETGVFGAMMKVTLCNDGPVTIIIDSGDIEGPRRG